MKFKILFLWALTLVMSKASPLVAQDHKADTLTNKAVISLKKAALDKKLIIMKIKGSKNAFDLSTNGLIELKKAGVDDDIIEAMLAANTVNSGPNEVPAKTVLLKQEIKTNAIASKSDSSNVTINYNGKNCTPAAVSAQVYDANDANILGLRVNKAMYVNFLFQFQIDRSTVVKIVMRKLKFSGRKLEAERLTLNKVSGYDASDLFVKNNVDENWTNYFYVTYSKVGSLEGNPNFPRKVGFRRSYVKINTIDRVARTFDGELNIDAETNDGTPLKIKGTFSKLSYDGGSITDPLYQ